MAASSANGEHASPLPEAPHPVLPWHNLSDAERVPGSGIVVRQGNGFGSQWVRSTSPRARLHKPLDRASSRLHNPDQSSRICRREMMQSWSQAHFAGVGWSARGFKAGIHRGGRRAGGGVRPRRPGGCRPGREAFGRLSFTDDKGVTIELPAMSERLAIDVNAASALWDFGIRPGASIRRRSRWSASPPSRSNSKT